MTALGLMEVSSDCHVANAQVAPFESKELSIQAMRPAILTDFLLGECQAWRASLAVPK